jgi:tyrosyl-tRNA synthetase
MPLLEGLDGVEKMSKSKNNYVGITESPTEMFGKLMSISDTLMWRYYTLLSLKSQAEISALQTNSHPRDAKVGLAHEIVSRYHSKAAADGAVAEFEARFKHGAMPEHMPETAIQTHGAGIGIAQLAKQVGLVPSTSEAFRLIDAKGLKIDGEAVSDRALICAVGTKLVLQAGKRKFVRVHVL